MSNLCSLRRVCLKLAYITAQTEGRCARRLSISSYRNIEEKDLISSSSNNTPSSSSTRNDNLLVTEKSTADHQPDKIDSREIFYGQEYSGFSDYIEDMRFKEDPHDRILRVLKYDFTRNVERVKKALAFEFESKLDDHYLGPTAVDIVIIGAGSMGSACAYFIKQLAKDGLSVLVVDKDQTQRLASTSSTIGGLCQQYSLPENIKMSLYGSEFVRNMKRLLKVDGLPEPSSCFEPCGYLVLAGKEHAENLTNHSVLQNSLGAKNILLTAKRISEKFPWLRTDDVVVGRLGLENEGWFDPWSLRLALRTKALSLGADYLHAEAVGFQFAHQFSEKYIHDERYRVLKAVLLRRPDGKMYRVSFHKCVIAAGANSGLVASLAGIGIGSGMLTYELPIEPRKRYMYYFHCPNGPGLNTPIIVGPENLVFRRDGLAGHYVAGISPPPEKVANGVPNEDHMERIKIFEETVKPSLVRLVPAFSNLTLKKSWTSHYEYNHVDMNGVVGHHPFFNNILFACGFNSLGNQHVPAVGRAISELILHDSYLSLDLSRFQFERFFGDEKLDDNSIFMLNDSQIPIQHAIE